MKKWKQLISIATAAAMLMTAAASVPVVAQESDSEKETGTTLTAEDIDRLSGGKAVVYTHDGKVTLVDGTCTDEPVMNMEDAAKVVDSMIPLMGGDENTAFDPWATFTDTADNQYYVFHQVYGDSTVPGGAVKVITDKDGNMLTFSGSVEANLPDTTVEGISKEEAEQIALSMSDVRNDTPLTLMAGWTQKIILPNLLEIDIASEDEGARYVWAVYTNNPAAATDLPYLAHYVTMSGEYLYNMPTITPGDRAGASGFDTEYIFSFMEPAEYTGYVDLSDGTEKEITVTVMRDKRTGMYYLGNLERRIVVADCYEFLYNDGQIVLESSKDNREWDQVGLCSLYNYCLAWDYYKEIGWIGGDNEATPILILNNFCDDEHKGINNASYCGELLGWQVFAASMANDYSQSIDIIAHEFTHCVTDTTMTYNAYFNDYGSINEALSDIQGQFCKMKNIGPENTEWILGEQSLEPVRSLKDPHRYLQPEYVWDLYYSAPVVKPTEINDRGGVHSNSSLLNNIAYRLYEDGGMTLDDERDFWFAVDCTAVPKTDYVQMSELLPVVLKNLGMTQYEETLREAIDATRIADTGRLNDLGEDRSLVRLTLPDNEVMTDGNWSLQVYTVNIDRLTEKLAEYKEYLSKKDFSFLPPLTRGYIEELAQVFEVPVEKEGILGFLLDAGMFALETDWSETEETAEEEEAALDEEIDAVLEELADWVREEFKGIFGTGIGSAGQDGHTIEMVCNTGYTIPILTHMHMVEGSMTKVDQFANAILIGGRWYDLSPLSDDILSMMEEVKNSEKETSKEDTSDKAKHGLILDFGFLEDILSDITDQIWSIDSIDDIPTLLVTNIRDTVTELPAKGLEDVTLPKTPASNLLGADPVTEGPKSRPKETETESGAATQAARTETEAEADASQDAA